MRRGGVAILLGAAVGVIVAALVRGSTAPPPAPSRSVGAAPPSSARPSEPTAPTGGDAVSTAAAPPSLEGAPAPGPSAVPAPSAAVSSGVPELALAPALPPVTTAAELAKSEVRCYETDPEECGRAADAYDLGVLVPRDAERATRLRRVELTRLVRRCEQRSPHACLVLAGRYAAGQGVAENDRHANALLEHARELCRRHSTAECNGAEPK